MSLKNQGAGMTQPVLGRDCSGGICAGQFGEYPPVWAHPPERFCGGLSESWDVWSGSQ